MGLGSEQESVVTPRYNQEQIVGNSRLMGLPVTTVTSYAPVKKSPGNLLVLPGPTKKAPLSLNFFTQSSPPKFGSFPDSCPPVNFFHAVGVYPDTDELFFRNVDSSASYLDIKKAKIFPKQCPGGNTSGGGGGAYSGNSQQSSSGAYFSLGGGGGSFGGSSIGGGMGAGAGGGGDDDPSKWQQNVSSGPSFPFIDEEDFNSYNYLDEAFLEDLMRDIPFDDIVLTQQQFGQFEARNNTHTYSCTDPSESDPPSTPAPLTPLTPMPNPSASYNLSQSTMMSSPQGRCEQTTGDHSNELQDLLDIQKMMINGGGESRDMSKATTLVPKGPSSLPYHVHRSYNMPYARQPQPSVAVPLPTQPTGQHEIDFLTAKMTTYEQHNIELFVPKDAPQDKQDIGFRALQHCYTVYMQYQEALKNTSLTEIQVANQQIVQLCSMELGVSGPPKLCFKMPHTCVPLEQWLFNGDHSVVKRQLVLQQLINTLTILFKAQNDLCFWGSFQVWVDTNLRVYLYVDFIKALAIQKDYAEKGIQCNPRVEDCKVLVELYNNILKPFLQTGMTWISPQLSIIFSTFEQLISVPERCISNMANIARVLGERRICKLQVNVMLLGSPLPYTIFCVEHETLSASLDAIAAVLPVSVARYWTVLRSHNNSPVGVTEMAAKEVEGCYHMYPVHDTAYNSHIGALYIESKQRL